MTEQFSEGSGSMDSPGELSFVSEHDTYSDSSDTSAHRQRQKKEEEGRKKKKKKKMKKKPENGGVAPTPTCAMAAGPVSPSGSGAQKTPKFTQRPAAGQTNGAFEPDTDD